MARRPVRCARGRAQITLFGIKAQRTELNWLGVLSAYGINALFVENYWNAGAPQAEERYIANLGVSAESIGC